MIYLGADHGGFQLKEKIKSWLIEQGEKVEDVGAHRLDPNDDYPVYAFAVGQKVSEGEHGVSWHEAAKGILLCRSAAGVVIAANKVAGIRAVGVFDEKQAVHSRTNNDANILGISGDWTDENSAKKIIKIWLATEFPDTERYVRRNAQIAEMEGCGGGCGGECGDDCHC